MPKDDEPTKKTGKRRKQMARKGLHTDLDKDDSEDSDEASEQDDSASGTKIPINPVPVAMKSPSIVTYKRSSARRESSNKGHKGGDIMIHAEYNCLKLGVNMNIKFRLKDNILYSAEVKAIKSVLNSCNCLFQKPDGIQLTNVSVLRVEMVLPVQPWTCTFLVAKALTTPE
ncbi:hypothetical protein Tco_1430335 [Tanacetum coccineum]